MLPEPKTVEEMRARYREVDARLRAPRQVVPCEPAIRTLAPGELGRRAGVLSEAEIRYAHRMTEMRVEWARAEAGLAQSRAIKAVIAQVADRHGITVDDLMGASRCAVLGRARREAIRAVHAAFPNLSAPKLGSIFGRDHTTILNALGRLNKTRRA